MIFVKKIDIKVRFLSPNPSPEIFRIRKRIQRHVVTQYVTMFSILIKRQYGRHCLVKITNKDVHANHPGGSPVFLSRRADRQDKMLTFVFRKCIAKAPNNEKKGCQHNYMQKMTKHIRAAQV